MEYTVHLSDPSVESEIMALGEDGLYEMASVYPEVTGLDGGVIFISTAMGSHGARVKFFIGKKKQRKSFSVSIEEEPRLLASSVSSKELNHFFPMVQAWVSQNRELLLMFWSDGDDMSTSQILEMEKKFIPFKSD